RGGRADQDRRRAELCVRETQPSLPREWYVPRVADTTWTEALTGKSYVFDRILGRELKAPSTRSRRLTLGSAAASRPPGPLSAGRSHGHERRFRCVRRRTRLQTTSRRFFVENTARSIRLLAHDGYTRSAYFTCRGGADGAFLRHRGPLAHHA